MLGEWNQKENLLFEVKTKLFVFARFNISASLTNALLSLDA